MFDRFPGNPTTGLSFELEMGWWERSSAVVYDAPAAVQPHAALAGAVLGRSAAGAQLSALRSLAGDAPGTLSVPGRTVRIRSLLTRAATGQAKISGVLRAHRARRAPAAGSSVASARLAGLLLLGGYVFGNANAAAALDVLRRTVTTPGIRVVVLPFEVGALAGAES